MNELEKLKDYLEDEYRGLVKLITNPIPWWCDPDDVKERTIVRGLGAVMFIQRLGIAFDDVAPIFEEFRQSVEDIIPSEKKERRI